MRMLACNARIARSSKVTFDKNRHIKLVFLKITVVVFLLADAGLDDLVAIERMKHPIPFRTRS